MKSRKCLVGIAVGISVIANAQHLAPNAPTDKPVAATDATLTDFEKAIAPHVAMARDVMLFCQQRDPAKLPTAYPAPSSADAAPEPRKFAKAGN